MTIFDEFGPGQCGQNRLKLYQPMSFDFTKHICIAFVLSCPELWTETWTWHSNTKNSLLKIYIRIIKRGMTLDVTYVIMIPNQLTSYYAFWSWFGYSLYFLIMFIWYISRNIEITSSLHRHTSSYIVFLCTYHGLTYKKA